MQKVVHQLGIYIVHVNKGNMQKIEYEIHYVADFVHFPLRLFSIKRLDILFYVTLNTEYHYYLHLCVFSCVYLTCTDRKRLSAINYIQQGSCLNEYFKLLNTIISNCSDNSYAMPREMRRHYFYIE